MAVVFVVALVAGFFDLAARVTELAVVGACFVVAPVRVDRAFSAKLLKRLVAPICLTGDLERPGTFSGGGSGRAEIAFAPGVARGRG